MKLFIIDTETTGLNSTKDTILEIAWATFDTESSQTLSCGSFMIPHDDVSPEITKITGITAAMTKALGFQRGDGHLQKCVDVLRDNAAACDVIIAHNAEFDRGFLYAVRLVFNKPWICSYNDLDFGTKPTKLTYMCADHGIPISGAHRAINDVLMLCQLLAKCPNIEKQIVEAHSKKRFMMTAHVSFAEKDKARDAGFRWDANARLWQKTVRSLNANEACAMFEFSTSAQEIRE